MQNDAKDQLKKLSEAKKERTRQKKFRKEELKRQETYRRATECIEEAKAKETITAWESAEKCLREISGYKDADALIKECQEHINEIRYQQALKQMEKAKAERTISAWEKVGNYFARIKGYKDVAALVQTCQEQMKEIHYQQAVEQMEQAKAEGTIAAWETAKNSLAKTGGYKDTNELVKVCQKEISYLQAIKQMKKAEEQGTFDAWSDADDILKIIRGYKDADALDEKCLEQLNEKAVELIKTAKRQGDFTAWVTAKTVSPKSTAWKILNYRRRNIGWS